MKILKFRHYLIPLVLSGEKYSTWRLFDDKNISVGDEVELQEFIVNQPFAKAIVTNVLEKQFRDLSDEDKKGHEEFKNDEEMYATYTKYYKTKITPETFLKIIYFQLVD